MRHKYFETESDRLERRARIAANLTSAKVHWPLGTPVRAETEDGPFFGTVTGHTTNTAGAVLVLFGGTCAYTSELTELTEAELTALVAAYPWEV